RAAVALTDAVQHLLLLGLQPGDGHEDDRLAGLEPADHFRVVPVVQPEEDHAGLRAVGPLDEDEPRADVARAAAGCELGPPRSWAAGTPLAAGASPAAGTATTGSTARTARAAALPLQARRRPLATFGR